MVLTSHFWSHQSVVLGEIVLILKRMVIGDTACDVRNLPPVGIHGMDYTVAGTGVLEQHLECVLHPGKSVVVGEVTQSVRRKLQLRMGV